MKLSLSSIHWFRVISSALIIIVLSYLVITLITTVFAFVLAFQVRGKPDQAAIGHFAAVVSWWLSPPLEVLLTFVISLLSTRKIEKDILSNGLIIGILAGMFSTILKIVHGGQFDHCALFLFVIIAGFGFLGGLVTQKRVEKKMKPSV